MTSGLDWQEGDPIYRSMYMSQNWVKLVMDLAMAADPGSKFVYCSGCSHVLSAIVQQITGERRLYFQDQVSLVNFSPHIRFLLEVWFGCF